MDVDQEPETAMAMGSTTGCGDDSSLDMEQLLEQMSGLTMLQMAAPSTKGHPFWNAGMVGYFQSVA
eukprot:SAG31_NODE_37711_length_302_cov_0.635468_1_plen_65_part_01